MSNAANDLPRPRIRFLLDTNVVIAVEPFSGQLESGFNAAARLVRLANEQGHLLCVAPATRDDLLKGADPVRRRQRTAELGKFHLLAEVPLSPRIVEAAGDSATGTNDHRDLRILAALDAGAASYLVSEDGRLRRRARRAGLGDAVLSVTEAVELLDGFAPAFRPPPPRVSEIPAYALDLRQPIFDSLRADYDGFDEWLDRVRHDSDNRLCLIVEDDDEYAAIAILKVESAEDHEFPEPITKICTFKVSADYSGVKYGELLLKAIFSRATDAATDSLYVEAFPKHEQLISLFKDFGFLETASATSRGEIVLHKTMLTRDNSLEELEYHKRFGPPALKLEQQIFVVPVLPQWHVQLFPDLAAESEVEQLSLFPVQSAPLTHPWGNALRKAYLCNSRIQRIRPGDTLLFYRSTDERAVGAIGVVENTLRSMMLHEIVTFVGRRTVYTPDEIDAMSRRGGGVLAIRFRQDRFIEPPWSIGELMAAGVLTSWPQSITSVREEGKKWIEARLLG